MPYITRDDGEHFVIPAYRDVLTLTTKSQLRKDILALSERYGEHITLQKRDKQYEVAFSTDTGYLLGESVWLHFKRPVDMIYCEAIPGTQDAILVVVRQGSIYLDGQFTMDSIAEELLVFLTQQAQFDIYIYGDVPISREPEAGKVAFDAARVYSFTELPEPIFNSIKPNRLYQLRLVDVVLKEHRIGVFPTGLVLGAIVVLIVCYFGYDYYQEYSAKLKAVVVPKHAPVNPYLAYDTAMQSPTPSAVIRACVESLSTLQSAPGWSVKTMTCDPNGFSSTWTTLPGSGVTALAQFAKAQNYMLTITTNAVQLTGMFALPKRKAVNSIYPLGDLDQRIVDIFLHLSLSDQFNVMLGEPQAKAGPGGIGSVKRHTYTVQFDSASPGYLLLIADRLEGIPLVLSNMTFNVDNGMLKGSILLEGLGT